jgi:hypothetical protein
MLRRDLAFDESDWTPNNSGAAFLRYNRPLLAYIGGKPAHFTGKDHNFCPGETVEKQLIIINNSRETVRCNCSWSLDAVGAAAGSKEVSIKTGEQVRVPLRFALPANTRPGRYDVSMAAEFSTGETQKDTFAIDVLPDTPTPRLAAKVALFDPEGESAGLLAALGVEFDAVEADADLAGHDVLVIGKKALTPFGPAPDVSRVRSGLKVLVFEQTQEVLEKRLGFRVQEYCLRRVFPRVPDHPALAGLTTENLRDWRGEGTTIPPRMKRRVLNPRANIHGSWAGLSPRRAWRCGCYGSVASLLIEKPACGDFLPLCDGGFSLQYSPLMEYREGQGMVLFCQLDVTGRTEDDPAARRLVRNILGYTVSYRPTQRRQTLYVGDAAGRVHLERAGFSPGTYEGGGITADQILVVGPGGGQMLSRHADAIGKWLADGGNLLALGLIEQEANSFLPFKVTMEEAEHISAYFEPPAAGSLLAGVASADVHVRDPRQLPLVSGGATPVGNGVLATAKNAKVVFCQLVPWQFDYKAPNGKAWQYEHRSHNVKPTFRHASILLARLLGNMGAISSTPMLGHFAKPALEAESLQDLMDAAWLETGDRECVFSTRWKGLPLQGQRPGRENLPGGWGTAAFDDAGWRDIRMPALWDDQYDDMVMMAGLCLYRLKFNLPADMAGREATLVLSPIDDEDWTYLNGELVGSMTRESLGKSPWRTVRKYQIPKDALLRGENILAIKVHNGGWTGGMTPMKSQRQLDRLENVGAFLPLESVRWVHGLYLHAPKPHDDPYRYYRW